jgi:hypothetical protein
MKRLVNIGKWKERERVERKRKVCGKAYLDKKSAVVNRERCKDVLEDFAESGTVDICHNSARTRFHKLANARCSNGSARGLR